MSISYRTFRTQRIVSSDLSSAESVDILALSVIHLGNERGMAPSLLATNFAKTDYLQSAESVLHKEGADAHVPTLGRHYSGLRKALRQTAIERASQQFRKCVFAMIHL